MSNVSKTQTHQSLDPFDKIDELMLKVSLAKDVTSLIWLGSDSGANPDDLGGSAYVVMEMLEEANEKLQELWDGLCALKKEGRL